MKTGDILLFHTAKEPLSDVIELAQDCKWQHSGIVYIEDNETYVIEMLTVCTKTLLTTYLENDKVDIIKLEPIFEYDQDKLTTYMLSCVGKVKYDYFRLVSQLLRFVTKGGVRIFSKSTYRLICSEFCGKCFNVTDRKLFPNYLELAPVDLYKSIMFIHSIVK